ncbi:hypothetical protein PDESU_02987 [Pontiella desulfatans]|uniref:Uncharacterized protein n=1 Tax=Pontiella desulfatans TaxID=2750659 RepID=A0A6C2U4U9_PONDE|nr:hypothetical protein [Pontiella desulfatans]VGO14426.1 hypothetical protein PDESU_02987 [Pontiella desulfatans]
MKKRMCWLVCLISALGAGAQEIATTALPEGDVGLPYNATLTASNGTPPYAWSWSRSWNNFPYEVSSQPNSFAPVGTAQGWQSTWTDWYLPLPFAFPFGDETYTYCYVGLKGDIRLGDWDATIYVLQEDIDTTAGDVYILTEPGAITIRWDGVSYWDSLAQISLSVTLHSDGTMVMKYGAGNSSGGEIGLNGNGTYYTHPSSWQPMNYAPDIVFTPVVPGPVVHGLTLSSNGVISGTPTEPYNDGVVVTVEDDWGNTDQRWLPLRIHADRDEDGMLDVWERRIVDDNPADAITNVASVLRDDNYDGDLFSNIEEHILGFDPLVADGNVPDTMEEGLSLLGMAVTNDPDAARFNLIEECFVTVLATEPTNHSARVFRALSRLLNLTSADDLYDLAEQFGTTLNGNFVVTGDFDFDTAPLLDVVSDVAYTNILQALDASFADLETIPTNWTGAVEISTNYFPVDETVHADIGDLTMGKAILMGARSWLHTLHAQKFNIDYEKMVVPLEVPQTAITLDGSIGDWAGVPVQLQGSLDGSIDYVKGAWNGSSVYMLMAFNEVPFDLMGADATIRLGLESNVEVAVFPVWGYTNIWFSATASNTQDIAWIYTNGLLEVEIPVPPSIAVSNACITDAYAEFGEYVDYGWGWHWEQRDGDDVYSPENLPIDVFKQNHPEFLQSVRLEAELAVAKTNLQEAIDLAQLADGLIQARTDMLMHFIEYDPSNITERVEAFTRIQQAEDSLYAPVQFVVTNDLGEVQLDELVQLGALYQPTYLTRAMAPEFWQIMDQPMMDTLPDPTFGGILPNMTEGRKMAYLWKIDAPTDWDDDGIPNGWELEYFGNPTNAMADADGDGDGQTTGEEFLSGSNPTNGASFFKAAYAPATGVVSGIVISWQSEEERVYDVHWTPALDEPFQLLATGIHFPQGSYTDTVHAAASQGYYRVLARMPGGNDLDADGLPDDWEGMYFVDYSAAATGDGDGDGQDNISEFIAGTDPRDGGSYFAVTGVEPDAAGFVVEWISVPDRSYSVKWAPSAGGAFRTLQTGLAYPANSFTDTVHGVESIGFYRVDVERVEPPTVEGYWSVETFDGSPLDPGEYLNIEFYSDGYFDFWSDSDSGGGTYTLTGNALQMTFYNGLNLEGTVEGDTISGTLDEYGTPYSITIQRQ